MKIIKVNNFKTLSNLLSVNGARCFSTPTTYNIDNLPYTSELYRKNYIKYPVQSKQAVTHDYVYHGKERLPSYEERMKEFQDPFDEIQKDIGYVVFHPRLKEIKNQLLQKIQQNKANKELQLNAKELKVDVPVNEIEELSNLLSSFKQVQTMASHYNIYKDLFEQGYFRPSVDLNIEFKIEENNSHNVYFGNKIPANCTINKPQIKINDVLERYKDEKNYHSLFFINLDGNFQNSQNDVLLWCLGNIENGDASTGKEYIDYIQPFPMRGTGWHRCVFLLFEHKNKIEFDLNNNDSSSLFSKRNFKTLKFYLNNQKELVPVGLSFFQTEWDLSVKNVFHNQLNMKEPVYEFDQGPRFVPQFEKYPKEQVFNWYLQEYMDKKDLNEEVMKEYLKNLSPFEYYPEPSKYPMLDLQYVKPRWMKYELESYRKRKHQYSIIPYKYYSPDQKLNETIKSLPYQQK